MNISEAIEICKELAEEIDLDDYEYEALQTLISLAGG